MTPEELKAEADANNAAWRCGTFDTMQGASMTIEDMEKVIKFHEEELAAEDERVKGTDEYPNYGDDFADMVHIARSLLDRYTVIVEKEEEREGLWLLHGRILNEIDCRIEHGADSNGHLEAIRNLFKENTDG